MPPAPKSKIEYKIRRKSDGLFSGGGYSSIRWTKRGKTWTGLGPLKNHLHSFLRKPNYNGIPWADLELVEVTMVVSETGNRPVTDVLRAIEDNDDNKKAAYQGKLAAWKAAQAERPS